MEKIPPHKTDQPQGKPSQSSQQQRATHAESEGKKTEQAHRKSPSPAPKSLFNRGVETQKTDNKSQE